MTNSEREQLAADIVRVVKVSDTEASAERAVRNMLEDFECVVIDETRKDSWKGS